MRSQTPPAAARSFAPMLRPRIRAAGALCLLTGWIAGCSATPTAQRPDAALIAEQRAEAAIGSWTLDTGAPGVSPEPVASTITISPGVFDRITLVETGDRQIEVAESGRWTASDSGFMLLDPDLVTLVITEPGDVSVESYEANDDSESSARLRLVGDRLVLEMLLAGEPVARYAYRRE